LSYTAKIVQSLKSQGPKSAWLKVTWTLDVGLWT